jgi:hypothetical protein
MRNVTVLTVPPGIRPGLSPVWGVDFRSAPGSGPAVTGVLPPAPVVVLPVKSDFDEDKWQRRVYPERRERIIVTP